ncbi:MAG: DNA polymerase I [Bacilli bacterium]|nr:DNA polymerase I [Bacilli bacterium]MDD3895528.1 DNA polymerase I [Bacilli bacterium]MDD4407981.1 DNA polymerase I [Bacilli bacterium]
MKKLILVDGNNLMYRSYYATLYSGSVMKNSKGVVTNALYGFTTMINKIIAEEKPKYMAVAFDIGKNFRHQKFENYKAGRQETPDDLLKQMPVARDLLDAMGIKHYEVENYEADDIIGTITLLTEKDPLFDATIVSSDKDLLQLISHETDVKLLKQKGHIRFNEETFKKEYGIDPIKIIDLKALSGDPSDNIPGVKGIGEKTALKLLHNYGSLENIYASIDNIKGAVKDKLIQGKKDAFFSKEMCTIFREVPLEGDLEDMLYTGPTPKLEEMYKDLEFYSLMKTIIVKEPNIINEYQELKDINSLVKKDIISYYIECDNTNYHKGDILGMGIFDGKNAYYVNKDLIQEVFKYYKNTKKYTYDLKKNIILLNDLNTKTIFDNMIATYLLNFQTKEDLAYLMNIEGYNIPFYENVIKDEKLLKEAVTLKARYIYETRDELINKLKLDDMDDLFNTIEMPLVTVLAKMEQAGVKCSRDILKDMSQEIKIKINNISNTIYNYAGKEFNISSPKQLGEVLFERLGLVSKRKTAKKNYSTDAATLEKLRGDHPIIEAILEYRNLFKLNSTYLEGLENYITKDNLIHTIYKQTLTRTGRLSSVEPNLQNIPVRDENGRKVRKAFLPVNDIFLCADYSQIELRVLAHISDSKELIEAFNNGEDIHTKVASDIFDVSKESVTKNMRRTAKAVIFGIVYGISSFGLGENLNLKPSEAKKFIDKYLELYPGVKRYMDEIIKEAHLYGSVRTIFNRKRNIDELANKNFIIRSAGERIALNTPIQGTAADIIKMAMVKIDEELTKRNFKSKMILQVHDELIFDVVKEEKAKLELLVRDTMENIVNLKTPIKVDIDYGSNWYEA